MHGDGRNLSLGGADGVPRASAVHHFCRVAVWLVICFFVPTSAIWAGISSLTIPEAGLVLTIPTGWTAATEGARYVVTSPNGGIVVVLLVVELDATETALHQMKQNQSQYLNNVRTERRVQDRLNGMNVNYEQGTAITTDGGIWWKLAVVTATRSVIMYTLASPSALGTLQRDLDLLQQSVRRS